MPDSKAFPDFDINGPGIPGKLFGVPHSEAEAGVIVLPIPWEATVTYHTGTALGPSAILQASTQVDLFHREIPDAWQLGIFMPEIPSSIAETSATVRQLALRRQNSPEEEPLIAEKVNEACNNLNIYVRNMAGRYLSEGKIVGLVGGDHSTPLGLIHALTEKHNRFGILQFDAHADLRKAYLGFRYSHASIMYNVLKSPAVGKLVQVGIRDLCEEEHELIRQAGGRTKTFFDDDLKRMLDSGKSWANICDSIVQELPPKVYISFDIDGLDPFYCPHTGTPVPGGLSFFQATELIRAVALSRRSIIGFDLNEVAPGTNDDWDANVGARLLWHLSCWTGVSHRLLTLSRQEGRN